MKKIKMLAGKSKGKSVPESSFTCVNLDKAVGQKVVAIGFRKVDGQYGDEPCTILYFENMTCCEFIHPAE